jgi:macrolide-specific efflux system membrane fusion protein
MSSSDRAALIDMARAKGEAEVRHWEEIYKPTPIIAPLSGIVIAKNIERGQSVATSDTAFVISDRLIVTAQVDETDLARIKMDQKVELRLDAYADKPLVGKVIRIAYEAKTVNNVTVYEIRVLPEDVPDFMRAGMTVSVKFLEDSRRDVVLIPVSYVIREAGASGGLKSGPARVLVRRADAGKKVVPQERTIELGINDGRIAEVLSGLTEKEIVLSEEKNGAEEKTNTNPFMPKRPSKKKDAK